MDDFGLKGDLSSGKGDFGGGFSFHFFISRYVCMYKYNEHF